MSTDAAPTPIFPNDAERAEMLDSVEKMIHSHVNSCKHIFVQDREDAAQEIRMRLWNYSARFDKNGSAKWSTVACHIIQTDVKRIVVEGIQANLLGNDFTGQLFEDDNCTRAVATDPKPAIAALDRLEPEISETDMELINRADADFRRNVFADALSTLQPSSRDLVEKIVCNGLNIGQVAAQRGVHRKMVALQLRQALLTLAAAGHIPADLADKFGLDADAMKRAGGTEGKHLSRQRRDVAWKLRQEGKSYAQIGEELGITKNAAVAIIHRAQKHFDQLAATEAVNAQIRDLATLGVAVAEIVSRLSVSESRVRRVLGPLPRPPKPVQVDESRPPKPERAEERKPPQPVKEPKPLPPVKKPTPVQEPKPLPPQDTFGGCLQRAMTEKGISPLTLADRMGVVRTTIYLACQSAKPPFRSTVIRYARALGMEPVELWPAFTPTAAA